MSLAAKVARVGKLTSIYTMGDVLSLLLGMAFMPIFTHYLVPEQMGIVSLAMRVSATMGVLFQLGLWSAMKSWYFRTSELERPDLVRTVFIGLLGQCLLCVAILSVAGIWIADILLPKLPLSRGQVYGLWLMILACCTFRALYRTGRGLVTLQERAFTSVGLSLLERGGAISLGLIAVVVFGWHGYGRQGAVTAAMAITAAGGLWLALRSSRGGRFHHKIFFRAQRTGITFIPHQLSALLAMGINTWLVNFKASTAALGVYGYAITFAQLIQMPMSAIGNAAFPTMAGLMSDGSAAARRQQSRIYTLIVTGLSCFALGVSLFAPVAMWLLLDKDYHEAIPVLPILVLAWTFQGLYLVFAQAIFYTGGGLWLSAATISSVIMSAALSWLLIPLYGMYGAAWAMVGSFGVRFAVAACVSQYKYPVPLEATKMLRALVCMVALAAVDIWAMAIGLHVAILVALKIAMVPAMLLALWATGVVSRTELARGRELIADKLAAMRKRT